MRINKIVSKIKRKQRTDYVEDAEELAEEVSVRPEVVVLQVGVEIIDQQLLLLPLLRLSDDAL